MWSLSEFVQMAAHSYIYHPPQPRPSLQEFKLDTHNILINTVSADQVHCRLSTPFGSMCTLSAYIPSSKIILFFHGNADDINTCAAYAQWLADSHACNVLTVDYPGYGYSSGTSNTSEEKMFYTAEALLEFATHSLQHDIKTVMVLGKSLGSIPAIHLASQAYAHDLLGLVLISPLASGARCVMPNKKIPNSILQQLDQVFAPNIIRITDVESPILVVHGKHDSVVSCDNADALLAATKTKTYYPPLFVEADHNDIEAKFTSVVVNYIQDFTLFCMERKQARSAYDDVE